MFEFGNDELIEQLIKDGLSLDEIADKWETTETKVKNFCKRKGINLPKKGRLDKAADYRLAVENGDHISPAVQQIIDNHQTMSVRQLAVMLKRTEQFVCRMMEIHCKDGIFPSYRKKYELITGTAKDNKISIGKACEKLNISYGAYCFICRKLGYHGRRKAA